MGAPSPGRGAWIAALLATLAVVAAVAGCGGGRASVAQANPRATGAPAPGPFRIDAAEIAHRLGRLNAVAVVRHRANDTPRFTEVFLSTGDAVMGG
jgi:hypothetical protein